MSLFCLMFVSLLTFNYFCMHLIFLHLKNEILGDAYRCICWCLISDKVQYEIRLKIPGESQIDLGVLFKVT
jgi:hypothetical protein